MDTPEKPTGESQKGGDREAPGGEADRTGAAAPDATVRGLLEHLVALTQPIPAANLELRLQELCDAVLEVIGGDHASVRLLGNLGWELLSFARAGAGRGQPPAPFDRREGVLGWVMTRGELADVPDTSTDPRFIRKADQGFAIGSMLAVPVWSGDEVVGVVTLAAERTHAFGERQREWARLLVNATTPAIALARARRLAEGA